MNFLKEVANTIPYVLNWIGQIIKGIPDILEISKWVIIGIAAYLIIKLLKK